MFLSEIRSVFIETTNTSNFQNNSLVINPLTTIRLSKTDIFVLLKIQISNALIYGNKRIYTLVFQSVANRNVFPTIYIS